MNLQRSIRLSVRALLTHRLRTFLAVTSVAIGVAAVVLISAIGRGAQREAELRIAAMGTNLIIVRPARVERSAARRSMSGFVTTLKMEDCEAIAKLPFVVAAVPGVDGGVRVKSGKIITIATVMGTTPSYPLVRNSRVVHGRFLSDADDLSSRRVAVLGARVAAMLFEGGDPLGRAVRIRGVPYEVIGVLESKGVLPDGSDEDNRILIPIRTALRRFLNSTSLTTISVRVSDTAKMDDAMAAIAAAVRERHGRDDFAVQNTARFVAMQRQAGGYLERLGLGLAGVTLLVGGAGILALMMMSVKERTAEIGLRMALGATPRNILVQFLFEATLLIAGGWLTGLAIGGAGAFILRLATEWKLDWPFQALLASAAMVVIAGLGFGVLPARRAAMIPPLEALRAQ